MKRLEDIHNAIGSILNQTLKPVDLIVSVDHNQELFNRLMKELPTSVKIILNEGIKGISETRNVAFNASSGDIIAFLDDDAIAENDWLENLIQPFEDPKVMAVGGEAVPTWLQGKPPFWFPIEFDFIIGCTNHKKLLLQANSEIRNVTGSNMAFRREVFEKLGGWENSLGRFETEKGKSNLSGGEEAEMCLRIANNVPGGVIIFEPEAIVHHKVVSERTTIKYVFKYCFREGLTRAKLMRIVSHYGKRPLAAENLFLRRLLVVSIPKRLANSYRLKPIAQIFIIVMNLSLISIGYLVGNWQYRKDSI